MSRIGKKRIVVPSGVEVTATSGVVSVRGPKGTLQRPLPSVVLVTVANGEVTVSVKKPDDKAQRALWGTWAAHIQNLITGVTSGFKKQLEVNGVGYKVALAGKDGIKLDVGFSHPVKFPLPAGVSAAIEKNVVTLESIDKEILGQTAAALRIIRPPEPYKGKGIKYIDEVIRRKAGKAAKATGA